MHIVGISGSPRPGSVSSIILNTAAASAGSAIQFTLYESLLELPHFSQDADIIPANPEVEKLRKLLRKADGVMICTPEYAFSMPSVLKNALEWTVSSGELNEMPLASISTSPLPPGGDKAHIELRMVLKALGAHISNEQMFCIGSTRKTITAEGEIVDLDLKTNLETVVSELIGLIERKRD